MHRIVLTWLLLNAGSVFAQTAPVSFNRDIRPILSDNCFHCHGPDSAQRQADLRLDIKEAVFNDRAGVKLLSPGRPDQSEIYRRIASKDASERMPPADSGRRLSKREKELIRRWIVAGANWQPHWSLIPPATPKVPDVENPVWPRNAIDRFVLRRLEEENLSPAAEAEKTRLIRRVSFDLTGLPPAPEEIDDFLRDNSPGAYERLVDRLLSSPRYGERMAMVWLDAARYADTSGYQNDGPREMWRYRDWVIEAFNDHMPYDQFTIEQIAGDLLPEPTLSQRIATGFNRNHRGNAEGGIIPEEYACEYVVDRVETTFTVWQGLTMGCARCHDHKFDPLSQKEFYKAYAFFNNIPEFGRAIKEGNSPPFIKAPTTSQRRQIEELESDLAKAFEEFRKIEPQLKRDQKQWESSWRAEKKLKQNDWLPGEGLIARFPLDRDEKNTQADADTKTKKPENAFEPGAIGKAGRFAGGGTEAGQIANFGYFDKFSFSFWLNAEKPTGTILSKMEDTARAGGYAIRLEDGKLQVNLVKRWLDDAIRVETKDAIFLNKWHHIAITYDGSRVAKGIRVYVDGEPAQLNVHLDLINQSFASDEPFRIAQGGGPKSGFHGLLDEVRIYDVCFDPDTALILSAKKSIAEIIALQANRRSSAQQKKLQRFYRQFHADPELAATWNRLRELDRQLKKAVESLPTVMVMQENPVVAPTFVLRRGQYDQPGERVERGVPDCLNAFPKNAPKNRLGFARWLIDEKNPLTARVAVNRLWQMSFGTGLVKTSEDFGSQGEPPSHPELLDWLATELIRRDWRMDEIQRLIVTSATYRQSSKVTEKLQNRDPENRLLARGPRFRLPAGMIRDQALLAGGLIAERLGGPSVKIYQPAGLWTELANEKPYQHDHGAALYRRSLYTYWKRTIGPPGLLAFDASTRETCQVRSARTNTPIQALNLMNDTIFVEASRKLAERTLREGGRDDAQRIRFLFRVVTSRFPSRREFQILHESLADYRMRFRADSAAAEELLSIGESPRSPRFSAAELAGFTALANVVFSLDEVVTRE